MVISAKMAAEICREWYVAFSRKGKAKEKCVLELLDAADTIEALEAAQPKWVSVEDHLPNDGQVVLAWYGGVEVDRLYFSNEAPGIFLEMNGEVKVHNVTHWMHLPELPKEHHEGGTTK